MLKALCPGAPDAMAVLVAGPTDEALHAQLARLLGSLLEFLDVAVPGLMLLRGAGVPLEKAIPPGAPPPPVAMRAALTGFLAAAVAQKLTSLRDAASTADALLSSLEARALNRYLGGAAFVSGEDAAFVTAMLEALVPEGQS